MLYDILIIDDDFSGDSDSREWSDNANKLLCDLLRDNLRVTWTTGEVDDLKKLEAKDLSSIKNIFLDLHLQGINNNSEVKDINGKIMGILQKINPHIESEQVTCYINSKYTEENYGDQGTHDLESKLATDFSKKYSLSKIESRKNALNDEQKDCLLENNLDIYRKTLVINKAIEVEKVFDEVLSLSDNAKEKIDFSSKWLVFQSQFLTEKNDDNKKLKKQVQLLQQIRNILAHNEGNLDGKGDDEMRRTFWSIVCGKEKIDEITIENFGALVKYVQSINGLCSDLRSRAQVSD